MVDVRIRPWRIFDDHIDTRLRIYAGAASQTAAAFIKRWLALDPADADIGLRRRHFFFGLTAIPSAISNQHAAPAHSLPMTANTCSSGADDTLKIPE